MQHVNFFLFNFFVRVNMIFLRSTSLLISLYYLLKLNTQYSLMSTALFWIFGFEEFINIIKSIVKK